MKGLGVSLLLLGLLAGIGTAGCYLYFERYQDWPANEHDGMSREQATEAGVPEPFYVEHADQLKQGFFMGLGVTPGLLLLGLVLFRAGKARERRRLAQRYAENPGTGVVIEARAIREGLLWPLAVLFLAGGAAASMMKGDPQLIGVGFVVAAIFLFIIIFVLTRGRPREATLDGIRLGFGRVLRWQDFVRTTHVTVRDRQTGGVIGGREVLQFRGGSVTLHRGLIGNYDALSAFINARIPADL